MTLSAATLCNADFFWVWNLHSKIWNSWIHLRSDICSKLRKKLLMYLTLIVIYTAKRLEIRIPFNCFKLTRTNFNTFLLENIRIIFACYPISIWYINKTEYPSAPRCRARLIMQSLYSMKPWWTLRKPKEP